MTSRRLVVRFTFALALAAFTFGATSASTQAPDRFYVFGHVKSAGVYTWKADMTVGDAIETAGGFIPNRNVSGIMIIRIVNGEKETLEVSLTNSVSANDSVVVK